MLNILSEVVSYNDGLKNPKSPNFCGYCFLILKVGLLGERFLNLKENTRNNLMTQSIV
jgi:hypothetical protein